jgi:DNA-directed RNA polymerase specialized sigma24 family protein
VPRHAVEVAPAGLRCCDATIVTATDQVQRAANTVFRMESAKLIAGLTRMVRDVGRAEELAQDALVAALEHWPREGIPDNPGAWLMATAKRRAIDELRRHKLYDRKHKEIGRTLDEESGRGRRRSRRRPTTTSATISCVSSSRRATRCCRRRRGWR